MKLSKLLLKIITIGFFALAVLFAYGYANSMVSYKYEVENDEYAGNALNGHQKEIISYLSSSQNEALIFLTLFCVTFIVGYTKPSFKGKVEYVK